MIFTDLMLANYKTAISVRKLNHNGEESIILKFETDRGLASVFLNENQIEELFEKMKSALNASKSKVIVE